MLIVSSVIVDDLYIERIASMPTKTNAPLIIDTDAVLPFASSLQGFEPVAGWHSKVIQPPCLMKVQELPSSDPLERKESANSLIIEDRLSVFTSERANHLRPMLSRHA